MSNPVGMIVSSLLVGSVSVAVVAFMDWTNFLYPSRDQFSGCASIQGVEQDDDKERSTCLDHTIWKIHGNISS